MTENISEKLVLQAKGRDAGTKILSEIQSGANKLFEQLRPAKADAVIAHEGHLPLELSTPLELLKTLTNLCWAIQAFPRFDIGVLSLLKGEAFVFEQGGGRSVKVDLFVPKFAWQDASQSQLGRGASFSPAMQDNAWLTSRCRVQFDNRLINQNRETMQRLGLHAGQDLTAAAPIIPASVASRIRELSPMFDKVIVAWDAEWQPRPLGDPLVIGEISDMFFLLDQFDVTKLERYVVSEFCVKK